MKPKLLRVPAEVAEALEITAAMAEVPTDIVIETAFVCFGRLDEEWRRQLVKAWWAEGKSELAELEEPVRQRGWCALAADRIARFWRWVDG